MNVVLSARAAVDIAASIAHRAAFLDAASGEGDREVSGGRGRSACTSSSVAGVSDAE
jgi:hypothetical protein